MSTLHCNMTSDALKSIKFGLQWKKCKRMKILWHWKHHNNLLLRWIFPQIGTMVGLRSTIMACTLYISYFSSADNFWNFSRQTYETEKKGSKTPLETPKMAEKRNITPKYTIFLITIIKLGSIAVFESLDFYYQGLSCSEYWIFQCFSSFFVWWISILTSFSGQTWMIIELEPLKVRLWLSPFWNCCIP